MGSVSLARLNRGKSRNSTRTRAAKTATINAASSTTSWNCMSINSFGTKMEASTNTSECAQKAICAQRSVMNDQCAHDEDEIRQRDGQGRFGQPVVAGPGNELQQGPPA